MAFLELRLDLDGLDRPDLDPERVEQACFDAGALSVSYADRRDDPILEPAPGEFRLWPATRLTATFDAAAAGPGLLIELSATLGIDPARFELHALADRAWEREWLKDWAPMRFGPRLWICPTHATVDQPDAIVVRLDPGLAFGTGTHPTTAMCLRWLERHVRPGMRVIDYGCGSGILAIAALRLGAAQAQAFDIDPQALVATADNAHRNDIADRLRLVERADDLVAGADLVVANILAGPLCELAPVLSRLAAADGRLALSGLLRAQVGEVTQAWAPWRVLEPFALEGDWAGLEGHARPVQNPGAA